MPPLARHRVLRSSHDGRSVFRMKLAGSRHVVNLPHRKSPKFSTDNGDESLRLWVPCSQPKLFHRDHDGRFDRDDHLGSLVRTLRPRDEILRVLKVNGAMFAPDISDHVGTGTSAVRPHLDGLVTDGLVEAEPIRGQPGRPRFRYRLTEDGHESFERTYGDLASCLIEAVLELGGKDLLDTMLQRHERHQLDRFAPRVKGLPFDARVREVANILDECGYMVELEPTAEGYRLNEHNCPVARVAKDCTAPCESELRLIRSLVQADVEQLEVAPGGDRACCYAIRR